MLEPRLREILQAARAEACREGIDVEFTLHRERSSLIRLGNSAVALATAEDLTRLDVTVQAGRRVGAFSLTADLAAPEQVRDAVQRARAHCAASFPKDYPPRFGVVEEAVDDDRGVDPALEALPPAAKTDLCARVIRAIGPRGDYDFSGSWSTGSSEVYYLTTANEREAYRRLTDGRLLLVLKDRQRKWELSVEQGGRGVDDFSAEAAIAEFADLLPLYEAQAGYRTARGPARVLFGPQAIAELVGLAVWGGFSGRAWEEQRAFTSGLAAGDPLFSPLVSLHDDPADAGVFGMPFDLKGARRRRFPLVEAGAFRGLMYSSAAAAKYGKAATGHDVENIDLVLATGQAPAGLAAGLALAGDALYIPHLHYTHLPDPSRGLFTGSSRFNALRVVDGRPVAPLLSTRITDTLPNVFSHVAAVAAHAVLVNVSNTYGRRTPTAVSVPDYLLCDHIRITDVAESF